MSSEPRFILDITHEEEIRAAVDLAAPGGPDAPVVVSHTAADAALWELQALREEMRRLSS